MQVLGKGIEGCRGRKVAVGADADTCAECCTGLVELTVAAFEVHKGTCWSQTACNADHLKTLLGMLPFDKAERAELIAKRGILVELGLVDKFDSELHGLTDTDKGASRAQ